MPFKLRALVLGVLLLLLHESVTVDAVTTYIAAEYLDSDIAYYKASVSTYIAGVSVATHQTITTVVQYSNSVEAVTQTSAYSVYFSFFLRDEFLTMFGPAGGPAAVALFPNLSNNALVCFAPFSQTQAGSGVMSSLSLYRHNVYWTLPSSHAQALGILFFLSQRDVFPIQQYSIRSDGTAAETVQKVLPPAATSLGANVTAHKFSSPETVTFIQKNQIRIVYMNPQSDTNSVEVITEMMTAGPPNVMNVTIGTSFELAHTALEIYKYEQPLRDILPPENIIISMPVPGVDETEYVACQTFVENAGSRLNAKTTLQKDLMMAGWASSLALMFAMNMFAGENLNDKRSFYDNLLAAQSSFLVGDLFIGSFGPNFGSSAMGWSQGAVYDCHTGGNSVWFHTFAKKGTTYDTVPLRGALFQYGLGMCANIHVDGDTSYSSPNTTNQIIRFARTVHLVGMSLSDDPMSSYMCSQIYNTIARVANTSRFWHRFTHAVRGYCLPSSMEAAHSDFSLHKDTYVTTSMMGVIPNAMLASATPPTGLILDAIPQTTQPHLSVANYIYLFPTLEQELYVLMSYVSGETMGNVVVCGVIHNSDIAEKSATVLKKTMRTFGFEEVNVQQKPSGSLASSIDSSCTRVVVVDAAAADVADLAKYLQEHPTSTLLVPFDDMTKQYASFLAAFGSLPETVTNRLVFATNLPTWTGTTMSATELGKARALRTVGEYVQTLASIDQTPAAARAFVVAMMYDRLTRGTVSGELDPQTVLFGKWTLRAGGMKFGPFASEWAGEPKKMFNYGATDIAVWSFTRVLQPDTPLLAPPGSPSLTYTTTVTAGVLMEPSHSVMMEDMSTGTSEKCMPMQASSSFLAESGSNHDALSLPLVEASQSVAGPVDSSSLAQFWSTSKVLRTIIMVLSVLLVLVIMYIVVLLLVVAGAAACLWRLITSSRWIHFFTTTDAETTNKLRRGTNTEWRKDVALQHASCNFACAPEDSTEPLTFVVVEVDNWRPLWVREAEVMSRAMRHYQRCVRQVVVRHQCYEMISVEGIFVLVCATVDAGVNVACDVVRDVASQPTRDASAVSAAYDHCGCGATLVPGLRLRVAVHSGVASRRVDATGRVVWSGGAVDVAVRAACAAGQAGMVVMTTTAKDRMTDDLDLLPLGYLNGECTPDELFVLPVVGDFSSLHTGEKRKHAMRLYEDSLHLVDDTMKRALTRSFMLCKEVLQWHYNDIPTGDGVADLHWICQKFCLPVVSNDAQEQDHFTALLHGVSHHLGRLIECRHGVTRTTARCTGTGLVTSDMQNSGRVMKVGCGFHCLPTKRKKCQAGQRKRLVFFAYAKHRDDQD